MPRWADKETRPTAQRSISVQQFLISQVSWFVLFIFFFWLALSQAHQLLPPPPPPKKKKQLSWTERSNSPNKSRSFSSSLIDTACALRHRKNPRTRRTWALPLQHGRSSSPLRSRAFLCQRIGQQRGNEPLRNNAHPQKAPKSRWRRQQQQQQQAPAILATRRVFLFNLAAFLLLWLRRYTS